MIEDSELLRRYVQDRSQAAFSELVQRRVNLVYSVALRTVGHDAHLAEDVTQKVFADLARKAPTLLGRPVLSGWLYRSAQFAGTDVVRSERRRRAREQETHLMNETTGAAGENPGDWEKLRPVLDEAMAELDDDDRDAVALRFFEERPYAEIGRALHLSEDTARKRVERALDKLHATLSRRGLISSTAALGLALANQVSAAPSGLAASITGAALASSSATGGTLVAALTSTKAVMATVGAAVLVAGAVVTREVYRTDEHAGIAAANNAELAPATPPAPGAGRAPALPVTDSVGIPAARSVVPSLTTTTLGSGAYTVTKVNAGFGEAGPNALPAGMVQDRYKRGQALARNGALAEALAEYLWCYDEGMVGLPGYFGVRHSFLLSDLAALAQVYPPAMEALQKRRDQTEARMLAGAGDGRMAAQDLASLNSALGDNRRNLELFDRFSPGDPRRTGLAVRVYPELVEARRYAEAAEVRSFEGMRSRIDYAIKAPPLSPSLKNLERVREQNRLVSVKQTTMDIEVLAGVGDLPRARILIDRLLTFDRSESTLANLRSQLARAGHPELQVP